MNIGELSSATGLSKSTIRHYEDQKILIPERNENGYRNYTIENLKDFRMISALKKSGLSLKDIQQMISLKNRETSSECKEDISLFIEKQMNLVSESLNMLTKVNQIFQKINEIVTTSDGNNEKDIIDLLDEISDLGGN
ncbi:MerR family transcriptional regulator [Marinilactibacillus psychrotolerans]|uniref:Cu(I)-responsive transcriptional regulator n=1 Tax=Marinilactibacillus psychrotolerans TaxID=191770 RepID=A0AAV3WSI6_9LACT|nr:MerR family transcriptional regulator [Marinilactibacillus psychrotolerans]GEL67070.1 Cu(I)-responsive transcriptional regulator [Marinilactibacillus psychrotolerans]GEQ36215.1 Cu(I)-responsive transcriptional regulator [Marinilactibacillus psychrotolerans]SDC78555.1 MerR HTH family regulatory protein [Marinilactibacillus psychrotolerans]